jgi:hypothetical protein
VPGVELSRTVGWFTSVFPVLLDPGDVALDGLTTEAALEAVTRVREHVDGLPDGGLGYGMLRHLNPRIGPLLAAFDGPQLEFNYLGRFGYDDAADWA